VVALGQKFVAVLALLALAACASVGSAPTRDLTGVWDWTAPEGQRVGGGYVRVELVQDETGRVRGPGVIDTCPRCAGFMQYDLMWEGRIESDTLVLIGTPVHPAGRHPIARFEGRATGDGFEGVLSGLSWSQPMHVLLERSAPGE